LRKLVCFIALAFDRSDVDIMYEKVIGPVLRNYHIVPTIVNRLEHNENIDQKIIQLIDNCDFAIADLTYARPSVYYEAGYAEREAPVIYIVRKDHFRQRDDDKHGNFCIHFDLQKKNIIPWSPNLLDISKKQLSKRIAYVTRPLLANLKKDELKASRTLQFSKLGQRNKLALISRGFTNILRNMGYSMESENENYKGSYIGNQFSKLAGETLFLVNNSFMLTASKKYFTGINFIQALTAHIPEKFMSVNTSPKLVNRYRSIVDVWMAFSLRRINPLIMQDALPNYNISINGNHIYDISSRGVPWLPKERHTHICLIDGFAHEVEYQQAAKEHIKSIEQQYGQTTLKRKKSAQAKSFTSKK